MKKATYTLPVEFLEVFDVVKNIYKLSKSQIIEASLINSFKLMEEDLNEPDSMPVPKKYPNTIPVTVNLNDYVLDRLNDYSEKLDIKKSHLVYASLKYTLWQEQYDQKFLDQEIDELMKVVEDCWNSKED
jgi:hypothetical protein